VTPLLWFLAAAGGTAYALHRKKWGWFFIGCAFMAWIILSLILNTYLMKGSLQ
jgi:hypothetical protein